MGSGQKFGDKGWLIFLPLRLGQVKSALSKIFWIKKIFSKNAHISDIILFGQKNLLELIQKVTGSRPGLPLIYCWLEGCSVWVTAHL